MRMMKKGVLQVGLLWEMRMREMRTRRVWAVSWID
jgi:hypothetical protein